MTTRRWFLRATPAWMIGTRAGFLFPTARAAATDTAIAETSTGKIRGVTDDGVKIFKGIPYGGKTAGAHRFMPPVKPAQWAGVRDAFTFGPSAPQARHSRPESEECLVLNVYTPSFSPGKRPVMVWLHGGGFSSGSGSEPILDGTNLARLGDVVVVTINHRLNVLGSTFLRAFHPDFAASGCVGMLDIVASLEWVRDNIERFGGDSGSVTIFGQSGGGRKVATLMSMPSAKGLFHRAIIESGALLRLTTEEDATRRSQLLLDELGLTPKQFRELQSVPVDRLLAADAAVAKKITLREPGMTPNSPVVDGKFLPAHPWDPRAPALSASIPLVIGWARTEETFYELPTPENLSMDENALTQRVRARLGMDPSPVIAAFREANPGATPWDLYILIATDHPRAAYAREMAKRKSIAGGAPVFLYRFDWETPEGGGHMRSPHTVEIPFVFSNIQIAGPLISKSKEAYALSERVRSVWTQFATKGDPNVLGLPKWPPYSAGTRETMIFNNESRVENDPDRVARQAMEHVLKLS